MYWNIIICAYKITIYCLNLLYYAETNLRIDKVDLHPDWKWQNQKRLNFTVFTKSRPVSPLNRMFFIMLTITNDWSLTFQWHPLSVQDRWSIHSTRMRTRPKTPLCSCSGALSFTEHIPCCRYCWRQCCNLCSPLDSTFCTELL